MVDNFEPLPCLKLQKKLAYHDLKMMFLDSMCENLFFVVNPITHLRSKSLIPAPAISNKFGFLGFLGTTYRCKVFARFPFEAENRL